MAARLRRLEWPSDESDARSEVPNQVSKAAEDIRWARRSSRVLAFYHGEWNWLFCFLFFSSLWFLVFPARLFCLTPVPMQCSIHGDKVRRRDHTIIGLLVGRFFFLLSWNPANNATRRTIGKGDREKQNACSSKQGVKYIKTATTARSGFRLNSEELS